jgi:hypothetical protein
LSILFDIKQGNGEQPIKTNVLSLAPHESWAILHLTFEYHTVLMDVKGWLLWQIAKKG